MGQESSELREEIEHTREQMGETVEAIGHRADVKGRVKEKITDTAESFKAKVAGGPGRVGEMTPSGDSVKRTARQAIGIAQENPIGLAAGAVATGFLVGLVVPSTRVESERIGLIAEHLKDRVKDTGQDALERGKQAVQETASSAVQAAVKQ